MKNAQTILDAYEDAPKKDRCSKFAKVPHFRPKILNTSRWALGVLVTLTPAVEIILWIAPWQITISLTALQVIGWKDAS